MFRPFVLAAALAPSLASALPWDGTYRLGEDADCDRVGEEGGSLRIAEGVFQGVGSTCRMTDAVDVLDLDATLYVMQCEGEGQTWSERAMLMEAAEGDAIFLAWRGYVFRYDRCPTPEDASADAEEPSEEEAPASPEAEEPVAGAGAAPEDDAAEGAGPAVGPSAPDAEDPEEPSAGE